MSDQIREEFEVWAKPEGYDLRKTTDEQYWSFATNSSWRAWQAAYAAGQKVEREAIQRKNEEWSKAVNKAWIETANEREGER